MKLKTAFTLLVIGTGFLLSSAGQTLAVEFEVTGALAFTNRNASGQVVNQVSVGFIFATKDTSWLLRVEDARPLQTGFEGPDYTEVAFDGTDVYLLQHFPEHVTAKARSEVLDPKSEFGRVQPGAMIPLSADIFCKVLWLVFASEPVMNARASNTIPPLFSTIGVSELKHVSERSDLTSWPPDKMEFFAPGSRSIIKETTTIVGVPERLETTYPKPYNTGYVAARLITTSRVRHEHTQLPASFTFEVYNIKQTSDDAAFHYLMDEFHGSIKSIKPSSSIASFRPAIKENAWIHDARFTNFIAGTLSYESKKTTNSWLDREAGHLDSTILSLHNASLIERIGTPTKSGWGRTTKWIVLCVFLLLPVTWLALTKLSGRNKSN